MTTYRRTSGYRNWINRRCYLPIFENGFAVFSKGRGVYRIRKDGWRRVE